MGALASFNETLTFTSPFPAGQGAHARRGVGVVQVCLLGAKPNLMLFELLRCPSLTPSHTANLTYAQVVCLSQFILGTWSRCRLIKLRDYHVLCIRR